MKKLIGFTLAIVLCFALSAQAATVFWTHDGRFTDGYHIIWWETANPPVAPAQPKSVLVFGNTVREVVIEDIYFKANVEYTFVGTAWNATQTSARSDPATWVRVLPIINPPQANPPTDVYIYQPSTIILNMGN